MSASSASSRLQMLIDRAVNTFGRADITVNNAGVETRSSILDTTEDQYNWVMAINLKRPFPARKSQPGR
jgi:glucose 1-dehydrogenase